MPGLDRSLFQKATAGRRVVKKVFHRKLRPLRHLNRLLRLKTPAVNTDLRSQFAVRRARAQLDFRDRRDRGQRLAAESERMEPVEIVGRADFGRRVPLESEPRVGIAHAATVIDDLNQALSSVAIVDRHDRAAGVDGILHQLLDDRSRTAHHLARGDLVGDPVGQHSDLVVLHLFLGRYGLPPPPRGRGVLTEKAAHAVEYVHIAALSRLLEMLGLSELLEQALLRSAYRRGHVDIDDDQNVAGSFRIFGIVSAGKLP